MGENTVQADKAPKKSKFKALQAEFKKIIWPDKESLVKQSGAVIVITIILSIIITILDTIIKYGVGFIL